MNKTEFIEKMVQENGMTKAEAEKAVKAYHATVQSALADGEKIQFVGFGTYAVDARAPREGHNPKDKSQKIQIEGAVYPKFSFGSGVKDAVKAGQAKNLRAMLKAKGVELPTEKKADKKAAKGKK